jgi:hypothetical protein
MIELPMFGLTHTQQYSSVLSAVDDMMDENKSAPFAARHSLNL